MEAGQEDTFDPYDMDREEFNADLCMIKFSKSCDFQQILSRRSHLDVEIQDLTNGLQNTLYDNYTKFITTSRVISNIKNNFEKMSEDVELLHAKMNRLEITSTGILENLQPRKDKTLELIKSRGSLSKLVDLIDLVPKLKTYMVNEEHVKAAQHYLEAEKLLKSYQHLPSFNGISEDSTEIISTIKFKLKERIDCCFYSSEDVSKTMELVLRLGEEAEMVLRDFFSMTQKNFMNIFTIIDSSWNVVPSTAQSSIPEGESKASKLCNLSLGYLDILSNATTIVRNVFLRRNSATPSFCAVTVLGDFMTRSIEELFEKLRIKFRDLVNEINDEFLANILDQLYRRWHDCCLLVPNSEITKQDTRVFLDVCRERCDSLRRTMESDFRTCLDELVKKSSGKFPCLDKSIVWFSAAVDDILMPILDSLSPYVKPEHKYSRNALFRKMFCKVLVREGVFVSFIKFMNEYTSMLNTDAVTSKHDPSVIRMHLVFSIYSLELSQGKVEKLITIIDNRFHSSSQDLIVTPVSEIVTDCKAASKKMLNQFARMWQRTMSTMFERSIGNKNWLDMKEPRKVSSVVRRVAEEFGAVAHDTELLLGREKPSVAGRANSSNACLSIISRTSSPGQDSVDDRVINQLSKLFSQSPKYFETVEFTSDSILSCIMESNLKCVLEHVRRRTFNCFGLQQMQVDLHYLENRVLQHLRDEEHFISLFDDVISSCYNRTIQPEFMNYHIISAICQTF